jgi:hypothetical protein
VFQRFVDRPLKILTYPPTFLGCVPQLHWAVLRKFTACAGQLEIGPQFG